MTDTHIGRFTDDWEAHREYSKGDTFSQLTAVVTPLGKRLRMLSHRRWMPRIPRILLQRAVWKWFITGYEVRYFRIKRHNTGSHGGIYYETEEVRPNPDFEYEPQDDPRPKDGPGGCGGRGNIE